MLQSFLTVGQQIITLYLLLVVGFVLGKAKILDDHASTAMSNVVMFTVTPCMMIVAFQRPLESATLHSFGIVVAVSILLHAIFIAAATLLIRDRDRTWGVYVFTGDRRQLRLRPLLLNPGVLSVAVAMVLYLVEITVPAFLMVPIQYLANLNTPLPMLVVGYQLSHANFRVALRGVSSWVTLVLRLVVLPLVSLGVCLALKVPHDLTLVLLIAASAPPAALLSMFAARFGKDTSLTSSLVSVQTAISAITMPLMVGLAEVLA